MNRGRPTKRTADVQQRLLKAIAAGNYYEAACNAAGITFETFNEWRKAFPDFSEAVMKAEALAEMEIVARWRDDIPGNWQAARDFLARRHPERWANKEKLEHTGKDGASLTIDLKWPDAKQPD